MKTRLPLLVFLAACAAGAILRFHDLERRPLHHDEGVNCLFLLDLVRKGHYVYDPQNYHGPLLYYMVAPLLKAFGEHTVLLRFWPAAIGTAVLGLFWSLRRLIGEWGAAAGAWLLALSPISVYFNRDLIHETWFVGGGALIAGAAVAWNASRRRGWILLGWSGFACLIATKETAPIFLLALGCGALLGLRLTEGPGVARRVLAAARAARSDHLWGLILATVLLLLLFTSLGSNPGGWWDMFRAYFFWTRTGTGHASGHEKDWPYFFEILWRYERVAYVLGAAGFLVAVLRREAAAGLGAVAGVLLLVHAAIPYKTPWLVLGFLPWLAASAGYLVDRAMAGLERGSLRALLMVGFIALLPEIGRDAHRVSFLDHDDDRESIVYSQTRRDFMKLVEALDAVVATHPRGREMPLDVMADQHFPLNWYVRGLREVPYWGTLKPSRPEGMAVLSREQFKQGRQSLEGEWRSRAFDLRPGVELVALIPEPAFLRAEARIPEPGLWNRERPIGLLEPLAAEEEPAARRPGLLARGYAAARVSGPPLWSRERPVAVDYDHGKNPEWTPPFTIEWTGYLQIPLDGLYRFILDSDDGSVLYLDDTTIVDNWGQHPRERREGVAFLARGLHRIRLAYQDLGGGAKLFFTWRPPGESSESFLPAAALSHVEGP